MGDINHPRIGVHTMVYGIGFPTFFQTFRWSAIELLNSAIFLQLSPSVIREKVLQWREANFGSFIESWPNATRTGAFFGQGVVETIGCLFPVQNFTEKTWGFKHVKRWDGPIWKTPFSFHPKMIYFHRVSTRKTCWRLKGRGDIRGDIQRMIKAGPGLNGAVIPAKHEAFWKGHLLKTCWKKEQQPQNHKSPQVPDSVEVWWSRFSASGKGRVGSPPQHQRRLFEVWARTSNSPGRTLELAGLRSWV